VLFRHHPDAVAASSEERKVAFTAIFFAVHFNLSAQHEKRSYVSVGQRQYYPLPGAELPIPQIDGGKSFRRAFVSAEFPGNDAQSPNVVTVASFIAGLLAGVSTLAVSDTLNSRIQAASLPAGAWMLLGGGPGAGAGQFKLPSKIR
jgi:hypothetical protein